MTSRFSAPDDESPTVSNNQSSTRLSSGRKRHTVLWALAAAGIAALPQLIFKIATVRRDLSVANRLFPSSPALSGDERLLILAPHPDDETLGTGGLIAQARQLKIPVQVVFLTNGDGSGSTQIGETLRRGKRQTFLELAAMRQREATAALEKLGVAPDDIVFLGFPDGGLMKIWKSHWPDDSPLRSGFTKVDRVPYPNAQTPDAPYSGQSVVRDIALAIENFRPTRVLTTDGNDTHADHRAAFCFLLAALEQLRLRSSTRWAETVEFWTYLVHHAIWPVPHGYRPNEVLAPPFVLTQIGASWLDGVLDRKARRAKKSALSCYESQMTWTPNYLKSFLRRNELFNRAPQAATLSDESSTRFEPINLLRDTTTDSLTRQTFPAADLTGLSIITDEKETIRLQIGTRLPPSPRCIYTLQLQILRDDLGASQAFSLEAKCENGVWKTSRLGEDSSSHFSTNASLDGLEIDVPLNMLHPHHETATILFSSSTRFGGKTLDETSTVALRLNA